MPLDHQNFNIIMHVAIQICDTANHQVTQRTCGDDRTLLSKKSLRSLLESINYCHALKPNMRFEIVIIHDACTVHLLDYCGKLQQIYLRDGVNITMKDLAPESGISASIAACYHWLEDHGLEVVAQFQDDYLFYPQAINDCIDMLCQMQQDGDTDAWLCHCHVAAYWREHYHNSATPRCVIIGSRDYWLQSFETPCTFVTTKAQFSQHWDLYETFFFLCKECRQHGLGLESNSLNLMFVQRGVLGLTPIRSLSHHVQGDRELDPHQDWRQVWNTIEV